MAGRGRAATLPAWMTKEGGTAEAPSASVTSVASNEDPLLAAALQSAKAAVSSSAAPSSMVPPASNQPSYAQAPAGMQNYGQGGYHGAPQMQAPQHHQQYPYQQRPPPPQQQQQQQQQQQYHQYQQHQPYRQGPSGVGAPVYGSGVGMGRGGMSGYGPNMASMYAPNMAMPMGNRGGPAPAPPRPAALPVLDPKNDVSLWSEHLAPDGRKYWFNRGNNESTFKKPICLKTPEERAIPDCAWTEFSSADGRKYYSDGKATVWEMPPEYRVWVDAMAAIEAKKVAAAEEAVRAAEEARRLAESVAEAAAASRAAVNAARTDTRKRGQAASSSSSSSASSSSAVLQSFDSKTEALEAFKALMRQLDLSSALKLKAATTLLQKDERWPAFAAALKTGEINQAISEFQTARSKEERDLKRQEQKKAKSQFMVLLAETVEISAQTRWREAIPLIKDDARYRAVDGSPDREELYNEFVDELEKQHREGRVKARDGQRQALFALLDSMAGIGVGSEGAGGGFAGDAKANPRLTRKSTWGDSRTVILDTYYELPAVRAAPSVALDEADVRRYAMDYIAGLEERYKAVQRERREAALTAAFARLDDFAVWLESWALRVGLSPGSRWRDIVGLPEIRDAPAYKAMVAALIEGERLVGAGGAPLPQPQEALERLQPRLREAAVRDAELVCIALRAAGDYKNLAGASAVDEAMAALRRLAAAEFVSSTGSNGGGGRHWTVEAHAELRRMLGERLDSGFRPAVERVIREAPPPAAAVAVGPLADEDGEVADNSAQEGGKRSRTSSETLSSDRSKRTRT